MRDGDCPRDIIAHALHAAFQRQGDWRNWRPLADLILAELTEAGLGIVPVRLQDRRLAAQAIDHAALAARVAP